MSDPEEMDSDNETFLPASQNVEQTTGPEASQEPNQKETDKAKKVTKTRKPKEKELHPCIYCGKHCATGCIQCTICALWCHMHPCTGLSKEAIRGLEIQAKEVGQAYWACRSCMNFNTKWNNQMREVSKRQDETEAKVEDNSDQIEEVRKITEELRAELREQTRRTEGLEERMATALDSELREREARRLNLVIHGLPELDANIKDPRERMERDKEECERLFIAMKARTRYQAIRFCRRIGEKGGDPRPMVFGVHSEEEKRHLLEKSKELLYTQYENVTVVPDMTKSQRKGEQKLRDEADRRNTELTAEDREKNLKWLVVGKRGEKRLIKGTERDSQPGRQERGPGTANTGWNPQIRVNTSQRFNNGPERRPGGQNWRPNNNWHSNNNRNYNGGGGGGGGYNNDRRHNYGDGSGGYNSNSGPGYSGGGHDSNGGGGYNNNGGGGEPFNNFGGGYNSRSGPGNSGSGDQQSYIGGGQYSGQQNGGGYTSHGGVSNSVYNGGTRPTIELGARRKDGNAQANVSENTVMGEMDRQARQQERTQVVEDRETDPQWRENGERNIRNITQTSESSRLSTLLPRPPILQATAPGPEWQGRDRLGSNKRGRSYDRDGGEEEEPPQLRNRRY